MTGVCCVAARIFILSFSGPFSMSRHEVTARAIMQWAASS